MTKDEALDKALEALECLMGRTESMQDALDAAKQARESITAIKQARSAPVQEPVAVYGYCPICGAEGVMRERRLNGYDKCAKGHTYPSSKATPPAQPAPVQEPVAWQQELANILCRIHRDGGHYIAEHGWRKAIDDADLKVAHLNATFDTTPPAAQRQWVGLTQQDIDIAFDDTQEGGGFNEFARAIEQRLKEKNT